MYATDTNKTHLILADNQYGTNILCIHNYNAAKNIMIIPC